MSNIIKITEAELICNHRGDINELKNILIGTQGKLNYICEICNCKIITKWTKYGRFFVRVDEYEHKKNKKQVPNNQLFLKN